ncbi:MAG: GNAT family N-acetyltransferase [Pseudomonadota bacterium]
MILLDQRLETERLLVRACRRGDGAFLTPLMTPAISRTVALWPADLTIEAAEAIIEDHLNRAAAGIVFPGVISLRNTGEVIGWMHIDREFADAPSAGLSCWLATPHQRSGYASETLGAAIRFAFEEMDIELITAGAQPTNHASLGLMAKLGLARGEEEDVWAAARQRVERCVFWHLPRLEFLRNADTS